jgi:predicted transcriptional regulator
MAELTTKEVAEKLDTTPRTLRKFLRAEAVEAGGTIGEDTPGKGKRYSFETKEVTKLQKRFAAWQAAKTPKSEEATEADSEDADADNAPADAE